MTPEYHTFTPRELWDRYLEYQKTGTLPKPQPETVGQWKQN